MTRSQGPVRVDEELLVSDFATTNVEKKRAGEKKAETTADNGKGKVVTRSEKKAETTADNGKGKAATRSATAAMADSVPVSEDFLGFAEEPVVWSTVEEDFYFLCMMGVGGLATTDSWMGKLEMENPFAL